MQAANVPFKCYCNSEGYSALAIENLSLTEGSRGKPCSTAAERTHARDPVA